MRSLTSTDWLLLEFLSVEPKPIRDLLRTLPRGTVYRRLAGLLSRGLVVKHGTAYALTSAGQRFKAEHVRHAAWDGLTGAYPPLDQVPTAYHRALLELALAALALRQHTDQEERHAGFLLVGPTLTWKSSAGRFLCLAAGVDPDHHVVDLAAESGKSLWLRRGPSGGIVTQRALLDAKVVVLDEYQLADQPVRRALAPFLSGRRQLPLENTLVTIAPVPIITMNPRSGSTLSARTARGRACPRRGPAGRSHRSPLTPGILRALPGSSRPHPPADPAAGRPRLGGR